ncbi:hypothetical protein [Plebeiibacterium sediminum]|uniref:Glycosyltransferase family 39 protein n=1 Tax=Plebeiibacterium sediminum TaxID=2992112 RepID=A0AAE3SGG7_9BACT|nr:hypothetical protein [Plebeiobacterium sediminum]MCW3788072.1 glycosyltransferase family 39 protein [Plebeiobacterium sediminum]
MSNNQSKDNLILMDDKIESWLRDRSALLFYILAGVFVVFSFLFFNARVSITGDDSTYITRAINFWSSGKFPDYQGPLYPIVLSLFAGIFGMNVILLKLTSFVFLLGSFVWFYKTFKDKISYTSLFFTMGIMGLSHYFLFFSSQTFSEAFFMLLQIGMFYYVFKVVERDEDSSDKNWRSQLKVVLPIVVSAVLMFLTKTIGIGAILALLVFFLVYKEFKKALFILFGFVVLMTFFVGVKSVVWDLPPTTGKQTSQLLNKHPYDESQGKEDFSGFIQRFKDNSNLYLSKHFVRVLGFKSGQKNSTNPAVTILLYVLFLLGFFWFPKRNKFLFFTSVYLAILLGMTFFSLQKLWDQYRLIIPYVPFVILFLVSTVIQVSKEKNIVLVRKFFFLVLILSLGLVSVSGYNNMDLKTLSKNIQGDKFAGFTPDWVSYLKMVDYVESNLSKEDTYVACRKPNIARIYAKGRKFYGVYRIPEGSAEDLVQQLKDRNVTHIIVASLRKNPHVFTGQTINTIKRYMAVIVKEYPKMFKLVKKYGDKEPTYLFEIDYSQLNNPVVKVNENNK